MTDNTPFLASTDPASPKIADDEVSYSGDNAKVQIIQLAVVTGPEGSRTVTKLSDFSVTLTNLLTEVLAQGVDFDTYLSRFPAALATGGGLKTAGTERIISATVAAGTSLSGTIDTEGARNLGLVVPTTFDGTQIRFQVSHDNVTFFPLNDVTNTRITQTVSANTAVDLVGELMVWRYIKIETVTAQATTDTVFQVVLRS